MHKIVTDEPVTCPMCVRSRKHTTRGPAPPNCARPRCQGHDRKLDQGPGPDVEDPPATANVEDQREEARTNENVQIDHAKDRETNVAEQTPENQESGGGMLHCVSDAAASVPEAPSFPFAEVAQRYHNMIENAHAPLYNKKEARKRHINLMLEPQVDELTRQFEFVKATGLVFRTISIDSEEGRSKENASSNSSRVYECAGRGIVR